jgi:hypothetical protein
MELAKLFFLEVLRNGGVWHLWGHSWEIEEYGLWDDLREVLEMVGRHPNVQYLANSELIQRPNVTF